MGQSCCGSMIKKPVGTRWSLPFRTTAARRLDSCVGSNCGAKPTRLHKSTAHGNLVMKLSALRSIRKPLVLTVSNTPPKRSVASKSTVWPCGNNSESRCAAARPVIPPPITATRRAADGFCFRSGTVIAHPSCCSVPVARSTIPAQGHLRCRLGFQGQCNFGFTPRR